MFNKKKPFAIILAVMFVIFVLGIAPVSATYSSDHNSGPVKVVKADTSSSQQNSVNSGSSDLNHKGYTERMARATAHRIAKKLT